jgi:hypothetical protein
MPRKKAVTAIKTLSSTQRVTGLTAMVLVASAVIATIMTLVVFQ